MFEQGEHAITKQELEDISKGEDLLIDFYADWCGPCKLMSKVVDEVCSSRLKVVLVKVNVDMTPRLAADFGVTSIPTIFCYRKGKCVGKFIGVVKADDIVSAFNIEKTETITVDIGLNNKKE